MTRLNFISAAICALVASIPLATQAGPRADLDGDTVPDTVDNCLEIPNAGVQQCDTDRDGYGNLCDADFNQDMAVSANDFSTEFLPDFATGIDAGSGTDMNCDGAVTANDFQNFFLPQFRSATSIPGPSGLPCAGTPDCVYTP